MATREDYKIYVIQYLTDHIPFSIALMVLIYLKPSVLIDNHFFLLRKILFKTIRNELLLFLFGIIIFILFAGLLFYYFGIILSISPVLLILIFMRFYEEFFILFIGDLMLLVFPILLDQIVLLLRTPEIDVKSVLLNKNEEDVRNFSYYRKIKTEGETGIKTRKNI